MTILARSKTALETLSTALVIVAASGLIWTVFFKQQPTAASAAVSDVKDTIAARNISNVLGSGPIAIVEFTDYQCPFCARHVVETLPTLQKELIDTGKVRYVSLDLPLPIHGGAIAAAEAAECAAEQGKFWKMHTELFSRQKELTMAAPNYIDIASNLGLDAPAFASCLAADQALARVKADQEEAIRLKVDSTPTLFVGRMRKDGGVDLVRRINGARPSSTIVEEVNKLRK